MGAKHSYQRVAGDEAKHQKNQKKGSLAERLEKKAEMMASVA